MRTLFIGSTKRGFLTLKALVEKGANLVGIISLEQDRHEVERYEEAIRGLAVERKIPLYETKWLKDRDYTSLVRDELRPDIALVVGCRILLPPAIYQAPPLGSLAVHDSFLPEYRGFAPLNWSIVNGENHTGVTLFYLNEATDAGDVVGRKRIPIGKDETAAEVYEKVIAGTIELVARAWPLLAKNRAPRLKQDHRKGTLTCSRTPLDGHIDWSRSTRETYDLVRALGKPYPGAFTFCDGKRVVVWRAKPVRSKMPYVGRIPGRVVGVSATEGHVDVLTGDGVLRLHEVQVEGEPEVAASQLVRSVRATLGLSIPALWEEVRRLRAELGSKGA